MLNVAVAEAGLALAITAVFFIVPIANVESVAIKSCKTLIKPNTNLS
jgi:hypothetical protein